MELKLPSQSDIENIFASFESNQCGIETHPRNNVWRLIKLPIITLTAKAMPDDQQRCIDAGANDYMAKPLDVEKLLSLVRVWMPR